MHKSWDEIYPPKNNEALDAESFENWGKKIISFILHTLTIEVIKKNNKGATRELNELSKKSPNSHHQYLTL